MLFKTEEILDQLLNKVTEMQDVKAIGISGGKAPLPKAGEGDIDIFIYCDKIPAAECRQAIMKQMESGLGQSSVNVFEGGHWGVGDFATINGVEVWLMYFTIEETLADVEAILKGAYPDKVDNYYYPIGRCAMFQKMQVLHDKSGFLQELKERLYDYPESLAKMLIQYHLEELLDVEDLERAAARKDVLFYHFAMDLALDHFLQALFAMNKVYFPSRKRTLSFVESFGIRPVDCNERLLEVIKLGSSSQGIGQSYKLWRGLVEELKDLSGREV